jgi:hypothetical protein
MSIFRNGEQEVELIRKGCTRVSVMKYYTLVYENGKVRPFGTIPGMEGGKIKENHGGVYLTMIYCKNFCKCHKLSPVQN